MGNPVVLFKPLTWDQTICVGVIQTIHQDSNHLPNPAGLIQTIFVCLKPLGGFTRTIPTNICITVYTKLRNRRASGTQQPQFTKNYYLSQTKCTNYPTATIFYYHRRDRRLHRRRVAAHPHNHRVRQTNTIYRYLISQILSDLLEQDVLGSLEEVLSNGTALVDKIKGSLIEIISAGIILYGIGNQLQKEAEAANHLITFTLSSTASKIL